MPDIDLLPLTELAGELLRRKLINPAPSYRILYNQILDGRIPAEQGGDGRWYWRTKDLPKIVAALRVRRRYHYSKQETTP